MEQERIPFDIKFRPEIEVGKFLVETKDGKSVRIVCWDKRGHYPIVALVQDEEAELARVYTEKGEYDLLERRNLDLCLVPNPDYKEPTTTCSTSVDWDAFRREAAKDILCAFIIHSSASSEAVDSAVEYADKLIKQLKEGKNGLH